MPSTRARIVAMRKIDWGGAGQIPEALGQDRCGSFLSINRYFFLCFGRRRPKDGHTAHEPQTGFHAGDADPQSPLAARIASATA